MHFVAQTPRHLQRDRIQRRGKVAFTGPLLFNFGGNPAGLYAQGHTSTVFSWKSQTSPHPSPYVASCA